ncbi:type II toxin-antitoxin system death-on-curing family toxin [Candidatus Cyanaurora vandensis]|uniref:type II toxin-antitoxin system death-on-curing family toxin n=1 Tax=Candidatus Cyanaurora vandensis TaxID=2714958 RepID=UPI002579C0F0|nr:type II toxin-antitoxin system death-on-curing family toxin [Candidatus Cyanaurora vandensis]
MTPPRWLNKKALILLHTESLVEHGGLEGLRDEGLLESALARPQNLLAYQKVTDPAQLAAAYGVGIVRNHPFIDGNKRVAFLSVGVFLRLNSHRLVVGKVEATQVMLDLAVGELSEEAFTRWLQQHLTLGVYTLT